MKATVNDHGQITIPKPLREKLSLNPGTVLEFDDTADCLKAYKTKPSGKLIDIEKMRSAIGMGARYLEGKTTREWLDEIRGPVELPPEMPLK